MLIDNETASINGRTLSTCGLDEMGVRVPECVEAASTQSELYRNRLFIRDLKGVTPSQFPEQFYVSIHGLVEAGFKYATEVDFRRCGADAQIVYTFDIEHQKWEQPVNLMHFLDEFCDVLRTELEHVRWVSQDHMESLTFVNISVGISLGDDCAESFRELDRAVIKLFRQTLGEPPRDKVLSHKSGGDAGYKWWVRYVVVPIICSGGFAALIAFIFQYVT